MIEWGFHGQADVTFLLESRCVSNHEDFRALYHGPAKSWSGVLDDGLFVFRAAAVNASGAGPWSVETDVSVLNGVARDPFSTQERRIAQNEMQALIRESN